MLFRRDKGKEFGQDALENVNCFIPNDGGLNDIFTILVDSLQDVSRLRFDLCLDRQVEINTNFLRFEI